MTLVYFFIIATVAIIIGAVMSGLDLRKKRRLGIYPKEGEVTMEDVTRFALNGETSLAVIAYREITGCSLKEAHEAIELIKSPTARRLGIYPKGKPTMEDVMRLALSGNTKLAARTYLISTGSSLKEAKAAVEKIRSENKEQGP